ncbi:uncharacterized protein UTRI_00175_B [Ustilago trichophora]|uniref:Spc7 kinetochore protein domain-containing protein n=1 Tax=Ustilago trichophora TaxID=86804 RepID=A0A5C3DNM4_9BASI|nr:uncharacterized protein UTRI_00175_B [Ustilago trichophora]
MPSPLKPRRSPRSRMSLAGTGSGGVPLGGSSMTTKASASDATKENNRSARLSSTAGKDDTMKAAKERATTKKRATSVGGAELDTLLKESNTKANSTVASTSRRNAPAPRKSAIRQVPQVFLSPTGLVPSPESRKGLPMAPLTEQIAQLGRSEPATKNRSSRASLPNVNAAERDVGPSFGTGKARDSMQAFSFSSLAGAATSVITSSGSAAPVSRNAMTQVIRPKRRVTFSSRQEKTEFARDEPTLRLGSLRREQVSPPSTPASSSAVSAGFASYIQSQEDSSSESDSESESESESDMDLDASNELAARSLAASIAASLPHDDSTLDPSMDASTDESNVSASDSTVNMDFTGTHGSVNKRSIADTLDDEASMSLDTGAEESMQMDITQAMTSAPALKRRRSSTAADESTSTDASADASAMDLDQTATMEFTGIHAVAGADDSEDSDSSDDDGEGMEMTKAITTKIEAKRNGDATTTSITDFPDLSSSDSEGDDTIQADATMPMEMTRAVTGFIREKDQASSDMDLVDSSSSRAFGPASSDDASMAMDLTMPMGQMAGANASPSKPLHTPAKSPLKLGAGAPSPFQPTPGKSPSRFRQSLRGGVAALETNAHSPAQRIGGTLPPKGHTPHASLPTDTSSFRRSIIGGIASPAYQHSPARRVQTQEEADPQHGAPLTADNLAEAGRLASGRAASSSPSSKPKASAATLMAGQRKSLSSVGLNWPTGGPVASSSRFSPSKGASPRRRAGRSSLVAAILPDLSSAATNDDSFHSAVESGVRSANGASSEPQDTSVAHSSDVGVGVDSFDDYSNDDHDQVPVQMPLNDFLRFVGVHFNDDMSASRRKPVRPTKEEQSAEEAASSDSQGGPVAMMRLVKAACGSAPQLEALREACREIKEQVDDGREKMVEMEQAFYDSPPDFVREIMGLQNEEERRDMEAQFKLQKQAARALVSADYYGWRLDKEFDQEMIQTLQAYHGRLQCDLHIVNTKKEQLQQEILPVLRVKHAKLKADLALARQRQAEIETCDDEELKGLYSSIEEQHEVLESMRAKLMDVEEQHERLLVRLEENREKMAAAQEMVDKAHATVDQIQGYTRGEAGRLLREIRNLEKLHLVRILDNGFDPSLDEVEKGAESADNSANRDVVLILDGWLQVSMSLLASSSANQLPHNSKVSRIQLKQKGTRSSNDDTNLVRKLAVQILQTDFNVEFADGIPQDALVVLRRISQTLIRQRILLAEIEHLRCRFPVQLLDDVANKYTTPILNGTPDASISSTTEQAGDCEVALQASVLLPNKRSKIVITATSDLKGVGESRSILLADSVRVERVYGSVDTEAMSLQILDCIETDPTIGSLSKAFIETIETFDS